MKKAYLLSQVIVALLIFHSCADDAIVSHEIKDAQTLISDFNEEKLPHQRGKWIRGFVYMRSTDDQSIHIFIENESMTKSTALFNLQTNGLKDALFEEEIKNAELLYLHKELVVNDLDSEKRYYFALSGKDGVFFKGKKGEEIYGYGLASTTIEHAGNAATQRGGGINIYTGNPGNPSVLDGCACLSNDIDMGLSCNSGGVGATSCSGNYGPNGSSCSVTCSGATYACCFPE